MEEGEIAKRYGLDLDKLKQEQIKIAKIIKTKDSIDFSLTEKIAAIECITIKNKIISAIVVCDKENNIIEQQYFLDKLKFPYLHEFRSYREVESMIGAFNKIQERVDLVLLRGHGITHPRLGLASHFSISANVPSIGVSDTLFDEDKIEGDNLLKDGKKVGKVFLSKEGSTPIYISPGNQISIDSSLEVIKKLIVSPHKFPEPMHLAHKYVRDIKEELKL
jgi:deoxyribonuclease V